MSDGWYRKANGTLSKSYGPRHEPIAPSGFPCPRIATDTMDPVEHIDGRHYDSKSQFRAVTKAHGYIEVGNDPARLRNPPPPKATDADQKAKRREAVQKAVAQSGL